MKLASIMPSEKEEDKVNRGSSERHLSLLSDGRVASEEGEVNRRQTERHLSLLSDGRVASEEGDSQHC